MTTLDPEEAKAAQDEMEAYAAQNHAPCLVRIDVKVHTSHKARRVIHVYTTHAASTWDALYAALERHSRPGQFPFIQVRKSAP